MIYSTLFPRAPAHRRCSNTRKFLVKYAMFAGFGILAILVFAFFGNPVGFSALAERAIEAIGEAAADSFGEPT